MGEEALREVVARCRGLLVWSANKGHGSFVTLDLGRKHKRRTPTGFEYLAGDLRIWFQYCHWSLSSQGRVVLSSESPDNDYQHALAGLVGAQLRSLKFDSSRITFTCEFSEGHLFRARPALDHYLPTSEIATLLEDGRGSVCISPARGVYAGS